MRLFAHPFSSYCWKALIALYANDLAFDYRLLGPEHPENGAELARLWPLGKFPLLEDAGTIVMEATSIVEHLHVHHRGRVPLIPDDPAAAVRVRMLDRIFDNYVMTPMTKVVGDAMRPEGRHDPAGVADAVALLDRAYAWLEGQVPEAGWMAGDFSLVDCAAAPSLFYADWVHLIPPSCPRLRAYRARLLAFPAIARAVDEARPYRAFFPPGAPDRD